MVTMTIAELYEKWEDEYWVFPFGLHFRGKLRPVYGLKPITSDGYEVILSGINFSVVFPDDSELVRILTRKEKKELEL